MPAPQLALEEEFRTALLMMNRFEAETILTQAMEGPEGFPAVEAVVLAAQESIGEEWEKGDLSLAQVYMSGVLCEELVQLFLPAESPERRTSPRIAIAVLEDSHTMGKRLVTSVLRSGGYAFTDYGYGLKAGEIAERAHAEGVEILLISTLMLHAALRVKELKKRLAELDCNPVVLIGGAPFRMDPDLWCEVGADGTCDRASGVIRLIEEHVREVAQ